MVVFVCSLGSGSSGNALLVRSGAGRTILIDCGVQYPRLCRNLARLGVRPNDLDAVYLSHEHSDHIQSARPLREFAAVPIVASAELVAEAAWMRDLVSDVFVADTPRSVGDLAITPCRVAHDAAADLTVIEANYDREMLENGAYPWFLKARIKGRGGHLSNEDTADLLAGAFATDRPRDVWLAHLSANNNTAEKAVATVTTALHDVGILHTRVFALPRYANGPRWEMIRHRQLTLFA